jgi:AraC-like DNA-binding protein
MAKEHYLVYIYSGELLVEEGDTKTTVHKGECVFIRRDNRVTLTKQPKGNEQYKGIFMSFKRNFLRDLYQKIEKKEIPQEVHSEETSVIKLRKSPNIESLFFSMTPYFNSDFQPSEELMQLKLQEGVFSLLSMDKKFYATLFDFREPWKIDIVEFMNENYMNDLSIEEIAHYTGRSLSTFKRDFKKITPLSPQKWLIEKRLKMAYDKIKNEKKRVSDVYLEVGFKNFSHFSAAFKKQFGYSPSM